MALTKDEHTFMVQLAGVKSQVNAMDSQGQADAAKDDLYKLIGTATVLLKSSPPKQAFVLAKLDEYVHHWNYWAQTASVSKQQHRALRVFPLIEAEMMKPDEEVTPVSPQMMDAIKKANEKADEIMYKKGTIEKIEEVQKKNPVLANKYKAAQTELVVAKNKAAQQGVETTPEVKKAEEKVKVIEKQIEKEVGGMPWWGWVIIAVAGSSVLAGGGIIAAIMLKRR